MDINDDYMMDFYNDVIFEEKRLISPPLKIVELSEEIYNDIKIRLKDIKKNERKYKNCLTFKLNNLFSAFNTNRYLVYSRTKNFYKKRYSCQENKDFWELEIVKSVSDELERGLYVEQVIGERIHFDRRGFRTRMRVLSRLSEKLANIGESTPILSDNLENIILRSPKYKQSVEDIKYKDTDHDKIPRMRDELGEIYTFYQKQDIGGFLPIEIAEKNQRLVTDYLIPYRKTGRIELIENSKGFLFHIRDRWIRRIFNDGNFFHGGRLYAFWQQVPKELRKYLMINGSQVDELDYSGCQVRMLYHVNLKKNYVGACPYTVYGYQRDLMKKASVITINALTEKSAAGALKTAAEKDLGQSISYGKALHYIRTFSKTHANLEEFFNSGAGISLMRIESEIIVRIILRLMKKGICALTIHDSCIFPIQYRQQVYDAMMDEYKEVLGFHPVVK